MLPRSRPSKVRLTFNHRFKFIRDDLIFFSETNSELNNTNDSLVAAQAKLEATVHDLQEKVKNNEDQLQVTIVSSESNHNPPWGCRCTKGEWNRTEGRWSRGRSRLIERKEWGKLSGDFAGPKMRLKQLRERSWKTMDALNSVENMVTKKTSELEVEINKNSSFTYSSITRDLRHRLYL